MAVKSALAGITHEFGSEASVAKPYERSAYRYWYRKDLGHEG